jgi:hypothetical protein
MSKVVNRFEKNVQPIVVIMYAKFRMKLPPVTCDPGVQTQQAHKDVEAKGNFMPLNWTSRFSEM